MAGDDREPIGRKGRPSRPTKQKVTRRRVREEDYDDEYDDDDYEDEKPVPRKEKATVANLVVSAAGCGCWSSWGLSSRC